VSCFFRKGDCVVKLTGEIFGFVGYETRVGLNDKQKAEASKEAGKPTTPQPNCVI